MKNVPSLCFREKILRGACFDELLQVSLVAVFHEDIEIVGCVQDCLQGHYVRMSFIDRLHDLHLSLYLLSVLVLLHVVPDVHNFTSEQLGSLHRSTIFGKHHLSKTPLANLLVKLVVTDLLSVFS